MSRHFAGVGSCAECRALRERKRRTEPSKAYRPCASPFLCLMRDGPEIERRGGRGG